MIDQQHANTNVNRSTRMDIESSGIRNDYIKRQSSYLILSKKLSITLPLKKLFSYYGKYKRYHIYEGSVEF